MPNLNGPNEVGAAIYQYPDGRLAFGPWAKGTPTSVNVPIPNPPPGSSYAGIIHSHPKGVPYPSETDVRSGVRTGAKMLCIYADGDLRCHQLVKKGKR